MKRKGELINKTWDKKICPGSQVKRKIFHGKEQDLEDETLSGEFRWISCSVAEEETCSVADSSVDINSGIQEITPT